MGVFSRVSDIVNANILHLVDKAEDPEKMIRLMIQEMEDTLVEVKSGAARVIAEQKQLERQQQAWQRDQKEWEERAALAVGRGRDDMARSALAAKARLDQQLATGTEALEEVATSLTAFRSDIAALEEKLRDAKARQKALLIRQRTARGQREIRQRIHKASTGGAFAKFDQFERNIDRLEGEVESMGIARGRTPLAEEFAQLEEEQKVEDELSELKKRLQGATASPDPKPPAAAADKKQPGDRKKDSRI